MHELKTVFVERRLQRNEFARRPLAIRLAHDNLPQREQFVHERLHAVMFDPVGQVFCVYENRDVVHEPIYSNRIPETMQKNLTIFCFSANVLTKCP